MQHSSTQSIYLSKKERIGLISLITLLSIGIIIPIIISQFNKNSKISKIPEIENPFKKDSIFENKTNFNKKKYSLNNKSSEINNKNLLVNPNEMSLQQAIAIGMTKKNYHTLRKYLSTGAQLKTVNDLKKIYGIKESTFNKIISHIYIPPKDSLVSNENKKDYQMNSNMESTLELNTANIDELKSLPGIGEKLAARIIKFRDGLGGFINVSQLKEVYGLNDSTYNKVSHKIICNATVTKIKINSSDKDEIIEHPYINPKQAEFIIQYRRQNGPIKSLDDLSQTNFFTLEWLKKIEAYMDFQ